MDNIGWQEIAVRLLFAFILGIGTAVDRKWYRTKQCIHSNILMATGTAMFSILASLTLNNSFFSELIIGISIVCFGVSYRKQNDIDNTSIDTLMRLWCAGAVGSMAGFGFFVPAYIGILIIISSNLLFAVSETNFIPNIEKEFKLNAKSLDESKSKQDSILQEVYYRCLVDCSATDEAEVLALLVQLSKEQKLMPTKVSIENIAKNEIGSDTQIQIDFISSGNSSSLQLQQVLMSLKSQVAVNSASWLNLSPELNSNRENLVVENQTEIR